MADVHLTPPLVFPPNNESAPLNATPLYAAYSERCPIGFRLSERGLISCAHCCRKFRVEDSLRRHHIADHTIRLICLNCQMVFTSLLHLQQHLDMVLHRELVLCCVTLDCQFRCTDFTAMTLHVERVHRRPALTKLTCHHCGASFVHGKSLRTHMSNKHALQILSPAISDSVRPNNAYFERRSETQPQQRDLQSSRPSALKTAGKFVCKVCSRSFDFSASLRTHRLSQHENQQHRCNQCGSVFALRSYLTRHIKSVHSEKRFRCGFQQCGFTAGTGSQLTRHQLRKHGLRSHFRCEHCPFIAHDAQQLSVHRVTAHGRWYRCSSCDFGCQSVSEYVHHCNEAHGESRPFYCEQCQFRSARRDSLRNHQRSQHLQTVFRCPLCPAQFERWSRLREHRRSAHRRSFTLQCDICGYSSRHAAVMRAHIRHVHQKVKPFACTLCTARFARAFDLRRHSERRHFLLVVGTSVLSCPHCGKFRTGNRTALAEHQRTCTATGTISCSFCSTRVCCMRLLLLHMRRSHRMNLDSVFTILSFKSQRCPLCRYRTNCLRSFHRHLAFHSRHPAKHDNLHVRYRLSRGCKRTVKSDLSSYGRHILYRQSRSTRRIFVCSACVFFSSTNKELVMQHATSCWLRRPPPPEIQQAGLFDFEPISPLTMRSISPLVLPSSPTAVGNRFMEGPLESAIENISPVAFLDDRYEPISPDLASSTADTQRGYSDLDPIAQWDAQGFPSDAFHHPRLLDYLAPPPTATMTCQEMTYPPQQTQQFLTQTHRSDTLPDYLRAPPSLDWSPSDNTSYPANDSSQLLVDLDLIQPFNSSDV